MLIYMYKITTLHGNYKLSLLTHSWRRLFKQIMIANIYFSVRFEK